MMISEAPHSTKFDESVGQLSELADKLTASIQSGNREGARAFLEQLLNAQPKLDVNITVPISDNEQRRQEKEFSVRVHVEDREATGGVFFMKVKSCDTVLDLKRRFLFQCNIPIEVQRWIIGKRIREDRCSLHSCGVKDPGPKDPGPTLFLYIVTAHSVGLTRESFEANMRSYSYGDSRYPIPFNPQLSSSSGDSRFPVPFNPQLSSSSDGSLLTSSVTTFTGKPLSPLLNAALLDTQHTPDITDKNNAFMTSSWPNQDTKGWDVGLLASTKTADAINAKSSVAASSPSLPSAQSGDSGIGSGSPPESSTQVLPTPIPQTAIAPPNPAPALPPAESKEPGWNCPSCTFYNLPTRPGCAICSASRPDSYVIPPDYQMTPEEELRLAVDEEMERRTREPGALGLTYEQEQENMLLQMVQEGLDPKFIEFDEDGFQMLPQSVLHEESFINVTPNANSTVPCRPAKAQNRPPDLLKLDVLDPSSDEEEVDA